MSTLTSTKTAPLPLQRRRQHTQAWTAAAFLLPALLMLVVFLVYPLLSSFRLSLLNWNGLGNTAQYVGLQNWADLLRDSVFLTAIRNNGLLALLSIAVQIPVGLVLAFLLNRAGRGSTLLKVLYFLPLLMSSVAIGTVFRSVYDPNFGPINSVLRAWHLDALAQDWLGNPSLALPSVIAVVCWQNIPFYMLLFLAGLSSMPSELREAATLDGASEPVIFWRITLPFLQGTIRTAIVLSLIGSLRYFDLIYVMTGGGPSGASEVMATYMYRTVFASFNIGYGATISTAMFVIVAVVAGLTLRATRRFETEV
ncbi:carbohydrate ABC transporter membrane protein 1, CUT1 family (plasmid) [Deinococcus geothermalis DSM 11300]|uniref:Carbohydrate ABC transporter membrane protein 1, CUT1 family n=1 Tax=Deinococcus geothermalis (strain DSM 11300 / CIP 105573 / AG-3a) TaxID=319795 RepID=Q1J306_DEIGD|nr:sugar ABC transporter permease [Deinococcus sp. DB0503]ABF44128.1 carbohydrate ABC transporter membrane protein 1, CUT1 family [Deinococcus geothermalis DSM 11300]MBI0446706.1 sugar ABC transporter permease [Deinococcus sp. DB0503]